MVRNYAAFSPDSKLLVTASKDETARLWEDGQQRYQLLHSDSVKDTAFSYDGKFLATVTAADNVVRLWNPQTGLIAHRVTANKPKRVLFSPDRELLAVPSGDWDGQIFVWKYTDIWSGEKLFKLQTRVLDLDFGINGLLALRPPALRSFGAQSLATGGTVSYIESRSIVSISTKLVLFSLQRATTKLHGFGIRKQGRNIIDCVTAKGSN
jgi:WD40 repeat protein